MENKPTISTKEIRNLIYSIRGKQVMLDSDLASLYQVETKNLNKAVKRKKLEASGRFIIDVEMPFQIHRPCKNIPASESFNAMH